jgi:hypothetical protein
MAGKSGPVQTDRGARKEQDRTGQDRIEKRKEEASAVN